MFAPVAELVEEITSGDWGHPEPTDANSVECIVIRATDFGSLVQNDFRSAPHRFLRPPSVLKRQVAPGDILIEMSGGSEAQPTGRAVRIESDVVASTPVVFSNFVKRIRLKPDIDSEYFALAWRNLYYFGRTRPYEKRTTGIRNFRLDDFLSSEEMSLPSLDEQRRIAHILSTIEQAERKSVAVVAHARVCSTSLIHKVLSDEATSSHVRPLADLVAADRPICYGILKPGPDVDDGVRYIRVVDYPRNVILPSTVRRTSTSISDQYQRSRLRSGDVLISIRGTYGRVAEVPSELDGANITQDSARISPSAETNGRFLFHYLCGQNAQDYMKQNAVGVAVKGVNIGELRQMPVPVPPRNRQDEIARILDAAERSVQCEEAFLAAIRLVFRSSLAKVMGATL